MPAWLLARLAEGRTEGRGRFVALFADVSGFTALTAALTASGREGAEVLAASLRRTFDPVVAAIHDRGGFVVGFAGDALTALFPATELPDPAAAAQAAAAEALAAFAASPVVETPRGRFPLGLKVGLSAGEVGWRVLELPGGRRRALFDGPALRQAGAAESRAAPGTWTGDAAFRRARAEESGMGESGVREPGAGERTTTASVPALAESFAVPGAARVPAEGEFRHAALAFVGWEEAAPVEGAVVSAADACARRHGGVLLYVGFEDKGAAALACFGAPVAWGEAPLRAARFVTELRSAVAAPVRAGLTHDLVYAGFHGGGGRLEFTCLGAPVNLAARLMTAATPGEVLVAGRACDDLAEHFVLEPGGARALKGLEAPVEVAALGPVRPEGRRTEVPLVGVDGLRGELADALAAGGAIWLEGPAGAGKSALAARLRGEAPAGARWLLVPCDPVRRGALAPLVGALRGAAGEAADDLGALAAWLQSRGAVDGRGRASLHLAALLGLPAGTAAVSALAPQARAHLDRLALRRWLAAEAACGPLVLHLEDAEHLDDDSLAVIGALRDRGLPVAVLACARSSPPAGWEAVPGPRRTSAVPPLDDDAVAALLQRRLGGRPDASLVTLVRERTDGTAFLVDQLAARLAEGDAVTERGGRLVLAGPADALPRDAEALLVARLDRLAPDPGRVARVGAVIGAEVSLPVLDAVCDVSDLPACVDALDAEEIWRPAGEGLRRFRPGLLRDAAYQVQARSTVRRLHARVADALERIEGERCAPATLAEHRERARQADAAVTCWLRAADDAAARADLAELDRCLARAAALLPAERPRRWRLEARRARTVLVVQGRLTQAADLVDRCIAAAAEGTGPDWRETLVLALRTRGVVAAYAEGPAAGERWLQEALDIARALAASQGSPEARGELAHVRLSLAVSAHLGGRLDQAAARYAEAESEARAAGDPSLIRLAVSNRGLLMGALGRPAEGVAVLRGLLDEPELPPDFSLSTRQNLTHLLIALGRTDEAETLGRDVLADAEAWGFLGIEVQCAINLASAALDAGALDEARRLAARARLASEEGELSAARARAAGFSVRLARLADRDAEAALARFEEARALARAAGLQDQLGALLAVERGHLALMCGEDARPWLAEARRLEEGGEPVGEGIAELERAVRAAAAGASLVAGMAPADLPGLPGG